jgi:hypothetical protein
MGLGRLFEDTRLLSETAGSVGVRPPADGWGPVGTTESLMIKYSSSRLIYALI